MAVQASKHEHSRKQGQADTVREHRPQLLMGEVPQSHFRRARGIGDTVVTNFGTIQSGIQLLNLLGSLEFTSCVLLTSVHLATTSP